VRVIASGPAWLTSERGNIKSLGMLLKLPLSEEKNTHDVLCRVEGAHASMEVSELEELVERLDWRDD
jgi:hypothetical protein